MKSALSEPHDADARAPEPVPVTPGTRLFFVWTLVWAAIVTPPLAIGLLVHDLIRPSPANFKQWLYVWARVLLFGTGLKLRAEVRSALTNDQPIVLVANHQNMLDIVTCAAAIPHAYGFAAKESLRHVPFIGWVLARSACLFVDRSTARRAAESVREAAALIRSGHSVLIYVEGERTYGAELYPFLRGAFVLAVEAGVPLVPVVHLDNYTVINERRRVARPGKVHVVVGEPIPTAGATRADIPKLMEDVRLAMERELARFHGGRIQTSGGVSVSSRLPSSPGTV